ncbi:MAG: hypothetical protein H8D67_17205 [Deltaproteobacteria bacterium]|nr:hypothetical protein [Deltaproteobacteria bacterium]
MYTINTMRLTILIMILLAIFLTSCGSGPSGRWEDTTGASVIEFLGAGRVKANFSQTIGSSVTLPTAVNGFKVDLGFRLVEYTGNEIRSALLSGPIERQIDLHYELAEGKTGPWTKVLFSTDYEGVLQLFNPEPSEPIRTLLGFKAEDGDAVVLVAVVDGKRYKIPGASFVFDFLDAELSWHGDLLVDARYRLIEENRFEVYLPLLIGDSSSDLVLCEAEIKSGKLILMGRNLQIRSDDYRKGISTEQVAISIYRPTLSTRDIWGVQIGDPSDNLYVNTGMTIGRYQNVIFRLPGSEAMPNLSITEPEPSEKHLLTIKRGSDDLRKGMGAFSRVIIEKGQTYKALIPRQP